MKMKKPTFLDCPPRYTRTPRVDQTQAEYGSAFGIPKPKFDLSEKVIFAFGIGVIVYVILIAFGVV